MLQLIVFFLIAAFVAAGLIRYKKSDGKMSLGDAFLAVGTAVFGTVAAWASNLFDKL